MKNLFVFKCRFGSSAGLGHVMRCMALAQELKKKHKVLFFVNKISNKFRLFFKEQKIRTLYLNNNNPTKILRTQCYKQENRPITVFDDYNVNLSLLKKFRNLKLPLIFFNDPPIKKIIADIVIDQNLGSKKKDYKKNYCSRVLTGRKFIMIRNEIKNLNRNKNKKKILITLGGASNSKNLGIIYQLLKKIDKDLKNKINLIFTLNLNDFKNFKKLSRNFVNIKSELLVDSLKVWKFFPQVDFSINSAGVTSLELAYLGIPQIIFVTGDNQINNAKALSKLGLGYFLGNIKKISKGNFKKIFFKLLKNQDLKKKIYLKSKNLIDGKGSKRIAHFIEKYYFNKKNYVDHTFD